MFIGIRTRLESTEEKLVEYSGLKLEVSRVTAEGKGRMYME